LHCNDKQVYRPRGRRAEKYANRVRPPILRDPLTNGSCNIAVTCCFGDEDMRYRRTDRQTLDRCNSDIDQTVSHSQKLQLYIRVFNTIALQQQT